MNLLMVSHGYPPTISGVTLVVQKIARAMVQKGHQVTLVTAGDQDQLGQEEDQGVHLVRVHATPNPFWKEGPIPHISQRELEEIADEVGADMLHAHEAAFLALQLLRMSHSSGIPVVATCYYVPRFVARYLTWGDEPLDLVESIAWAYTIWIFNQFDQVAFGTAAHRDMFIEQGLQAPTTIISNGLDLARYCPHGDRLDVEERYALPPRPRILFVSRLARDKEIETLIRAMPRIWMEQRGHLLLVGRGDDRPRLEELVEALELQHCVHFLGYLPEEDMPALYRSVDLFAIASTCEVQSLPTLQAVATGLPVVAADAVALPELVHNGINGFLVPPADPAAMAKAILKILQDPPLAVRMGEASLAIAQPHANGHTFDLYEQLYQEICSERRSDQWKARPIVPLSHSARLLELLPLHPVQRPASAEPWIHAAVWGGLASHDISTSTLAMFPPLWL